MGIQENDLSGLVGAFPVCGQCGTSAVMRDAWAVWNREAGAWELQATFDQFRCETCGKSTALDWKIDEDFRKARVRQLNDGLRRGNVRHGTILITSGIEALGGEVCASILQRISAFDDFTVDNDPYSEHDFGSLDQCGENIFWKIDYYDREMQGHSPDKANPDVTQRVLTIMLASEY